jgi:hypothetical protein
VAGKWEAARVLLLTVAGTAGALLPGGARPPRRREWPRWWGGASGVPATANEEGNEIVRMANHLGPKAQLTCASAIILLAQLWADSNLAPSARHSGLTRH